MRWTIGDDSLTRHRGIKRLRSLILWT